MPNVTIRDVAREAEVSVATVSRVLNGVASVDETLAAQVRAAAMTLGYVPNAVGRALRLQRTNTWALVVDELNAFITGLVSSIERAAARNQTSVSLGITGYDTEQEHRHLQAVLRRRDSGLIVGHALSQEPYRDVDIPLIFVDRDFPDSPHDSVTVDNRAAGRLMAEHLVERGFRRLACIGHQDAGAPVTHRIDGFLQACHDLGVGQPPEYARAMGPWVGGGRAGLLDLAALAEPPEVVFCANGPLTQGAHLGLEATTGPRIALCGVDDEDWTSLASPSITVVRQPIEEIGQTTARLLERRIAGDTSPRQRVVLPGELVVRDSTRR